MKSYRKAFWVALAANAVLAAIVVALWSGAWTMKPAGRSAAQASAVGVAMNAGPAKGSEETEPPLAPLQVSPGRLQRIGLTTGKVSSEPVEDQIATTGNVAVDETRIAYIQLRFSGYIQKVFIDATYQYVRKGQPLFTIYSPDLVSTEREYLLALRSQRRLAHVSDPEIARDTGSTVQAAAQRLKQWDLPEREIARLEATGRVRQNLEIDSPVSGYVTEREALPNRFVQPDTRLYTVTDLSRIWVFAQVFQNDLGRLKVGDPATLTVDTYPGRTFTGRIDFIYPNVDVTTRTARVRLAFTNPHLELSPGMFVNVSFEIPMGRHVVIPASGVLQTGTRQIVFLDHGEGSLEPRDVQLGPRVDDKFIVEKGLKAGERIVTSANFLIDSESQLEAALGAFAPAAPAGGSAAAATTAGRPSIELSTEPSPPRTGRNLVRVKLAAAAGAPVSGAEVTATFFLPAMPAMGMAAMRVPVRLADRGNGVYEGTAQLQSGGTWQVTVAARRNDQVIASSQFSVTAGGGL